MPIEPINPLRRVSSGQLPRADDINQLVSAYERMNPLRSSPKIHPRQLGNQNTGNLDNSFSVTAASTTEIDIKGGTWTRNGYPIDVVDSTLTISATAYIWAQLTASSNDASLLPDTLTIVQTATYAPPIVPDRYNTCWFLATVNWDTDHITTITQYWQGGDIDDTVMKGDSDTPAPTAQILKSIERNPTSGAHQLYDFDTVALGDFAIIPTAPAAGPIATLEWKNMSEVIEIAGLGNGTSSSIGTVIGSSPSVQAALKLYFDTVYDPIGNPDHNDLPGLQGGQLSPAEYYHLTLDQYTLVDDLVTTGDIYWETGENYVKNYGTSIGLDASTPVIDLTNRLLSGPSGYTALDWANRTLKEGASSTVSLNWSTRDLYESDGTTTSLNWNSRILYDSSAYNSVDWENHTLDNASGVTVFDWSAATTSAIAAAKVDYTTGDLDTEAEIITAFNTTNGLINDLRALLNKYAMQTTTP